MERFIAALALLSAVMIPVHCSSFFVVVPGEIRPDMPFPVNVITLSGTGGRFKVEILMSTDPAWSNSNVEVTIPSGQTIGTASIDNVPMDLPDGAEYLVQVTDLGTGALAPTQTLSAYVPPSMLFIQSDKGMYKPGDTVNFRVLYTAVDLKPVYDDIKVEIKDPLGNDIVVDSWSSQTLVSGSFVLSADPLFGKHQIYAEAGESAFKYATFLVEEYDLPLFEVQLEMDNSYVVIPSFGTSSMGTIKGRVKAIYTNGELVLGDMVLKVNGVVRKRFASFTGSAMFEIELDERQPAGSLTVLALMTEKHTDNTANATQVISAVEAPFKASVRTPIPHTSISTPYMFTVALTDPTGGQLPSALASASYRLKYSADYNSASGNAIYSSEGDIAYTGSPVTVTLTPDAAWREPLLKKVRVHFETGSDRSLPSEIKPRQYTTENGGAMLQIVKDSAATTQDQVCVTITPISTRVVNPNNIYYQIVDTVNPRPIQHYNGNTQNCVPIAKSFAPKSKIVAFYVDTSSEKTELLAATVDLLVEWKADLGVSIEIVPTTAKPGDTVNIMVQTEPATEAIIGLSAVDKSTTFLASANDITKTSLQEAKTWVQLYDRPTTVPDQPPFPMARGGGIMPAKPIFVDRKKRCVSGYPTYQTTVTPKEIIHSAGLLVVTDATVHGFVSGGCRDDVVFLEKGPAPGGAGNVVDDMEDNNGDVQATEPEVSERTEFPETWLWELMTTERQTGSTSQEFELPDTITNWVVNAFGISESAGLGVAETKEVTATQDLFVAMDLPYSVVRNEQFDLKILAFNYQSSAQEVIIELEDDDSTGYTINESTSTITSKWIPAGQSDVLVVGIKATEIGTITLRASASSGIHTDIEQRELIVKSEGRELTQSKEIVLDVGSSTTYDLASLIVGEEIVEDSPRFYVRVTGDVIMGPVISNMEGRLRIPTGCGEQNMITLIPSVYVAKYLKSINRYKQEIKNKVERYSGIGYRKELQYGHKPGGGYSAFGPSTNKCGCDRPDADDGPNASTWLTATVLGTFSVMHQQQVTFVSPVELQSSAKFLCDQRATVAENAKSFFLEPGRVIHKEMQGGAGSPGVALSAMVLSALVDYRDATGDQDFDACIDAAREWLVIKADGLTNAYGLAIVAHALAKAGNTQKANDLLARFESDYTGYGSPDFQAQPPCNGCDVMPEYSHRQTGESTVETLGYLLTAYVEVGNEGMGGEKKDLLLALRKAGGAFRSTQDTAVGLRALAEYSSAFPSATADFTVALTDSSQQPVAEAVSMTMDNYYALFERPIQMEYNPDGMDVKVDVTGSAGTAGVTFVAFYNSEANATVRQLDLDVTVTTRRDGITLVNPCFRVNPVVNQSAPTMILVSVGEATGQEYASSLKVDTVAQKVEHNSQEGVVYIYYDPPVGTEKVCASVPMRNKFTVTDRQPATVSVRNYYEPEQSVERLYRTQDACTVDCDDDVLGASSIRINALLLVGALALALLYQALGRQ